MRTNWHVFIDLMKDYHHWLVGFTGALIYASLRRDVPKYQIILFAIIGIPLAVFVIAPGIASIFSLGRDAEKTIIFLIGFLGRDVIIGLGKLSKKFANDPASFWPHKK